MRKGQSVQIFLRRRIRDCHQPSEGAQCEAKSSKKVRDEIAVDKMVVGWKG